MRSVWMVFLSLWLLVGCGVIFDRETIKSFEAELLFPELPVGLSEYDGSDNLEVSFKVKDRNVDFVKLQLINEETCENYVYEDSIKHRVSQPYVFRPYHGKNIFCYKTHSTLTGEDSDKIFSSQVFVADSQRINSMEIVNSSANPGRREGASLVKSDDDRLFLFGGKRDSTYLNDLWIFSKTPSNPEGKWEKIVPATSGPSNRAFHQSTFHKGKLYVFGGTDGITRNYNSTFSSAFGDMWTFDLTSGQWEQIVLGSAMNTIERHRRDGHLFSINGHLYLHGGSSGVSNFCHYHRPIRFDEVLKDFVPVTLQITGTVGCRTRASGSVVGNSFYVMGGYNGSNFTNDIWIFTPSSNGTSGTFQNISPINPPPVRDRHMSFEAFGDFWIFGGYCYPNNECSDLWRLDTQSLSWHSSGFVAPVPERKSASVARIGSRLFTVGGTFRSSQFDVGALEYWDLGASELSPLRSAYLQIPSYFVPLLGDRNSYYLMNSSDGSVWKMDLPFANSLREMPTSLALVKDYQHRIVTEDRIYFFNSLSTIRSWSPEEGLKLVVQNNAGPSGYFYPNYTIMNNKIEAPILIDENTGVFENLHWTFDLVTGLWSSRPVPVSLRDYFAEQTISTDQVVFFSRAYDINWSPAGDSIVSLLNDGSLGTPSAPTLSFASPSNSIFALRVKESIYVFDSSGSSQAWVIQSDKTESRLSFVRSAELTALMGAQTWGPFWGSSFYHQGSVYFLNSRIGSGDSVTLIRLRLE